MSNHLNIFVKYHFVGKQGFTAYKRDDLNAVPLDSQKDSVLPSPIMSTSQLCVVRMIHCTLSPTLNAPPISLQSSIFITP